MTGVSAVALAFAGGFIPSLIWLAFWLREDRCEPEPKIRIILTFLAGIAAVAPVLWLERTAAAFVDPAMLQGAVPSLILLLLWAMFEEVFKVLAATVFGLASRSYDEPIDAIIYMVTAALGFSAAENSLFLLTPLMNGDIVHGLLNENLRFVGATLLHVLASSSVGLCLAFAFYRGKVARFDALSFGLILAILLHTLFNFFILEEAGRSMVFFIFMIMWAAVVVTLFFIERVKHPARDYC